jgi:hypothetical protein
LKVLFGKEHPQPNKDEIKFSDFKSLRPSLQAQLGVLGFDKPMPVQHETLKATLQGRYVFQNIPKKKNLENARTLFCPFFFQGRCH